MNNDLEKRNFNTGEVWGSVKEGFRFVLPELKDEAYCMAQVDDYMKYARWNFPHEPPLRIRLEARASGADLPGTWGFGLWNDPFCLGINAGGVSRVLPVMPNAAWFFYGSTKNHLSLYDDLPGSGFLARTYRAPLFPGILSLAEVPLFPFLISKKGCRFLRRMARFVVKESACVVDVDVCQWHGYKLDWYKKEVVFAIDEQVIFRTPLSPRGRLGFVLWIDNQYFRFDPTGSLGFGFQPILTEQWLEVKGINISTL